MLALLLLIVPLVSAFPEGDHHGDGHDDHCVDISKYSEILYNVSIVDLCTYRTSRVCTQKTSSACVAIPSQECSVIGYAKCISDSFAQVVHDDSVQQSSFVAKTCVESGTETLNEHHKTPECKNVTREHCDSKWVLNAEGEKVWAGNENCQLLTWEECELVDVMNPIQVPVYSCIDDATTYYNVPVLNEVEVNGFITTCAAAAYAECTTSSKQECVEIEYEECTDIVEPFCFGDMEFNLPYQTYDHRLKCIL